MRRILLTFAFTCLLVGAMGGMIGQSNAAVEAGVTHVSSHPYLYFSADSLDRIRQSRFATPNYLHESSFSIGYFGGYTITYPVPTPQPPDREPPPGFPQSTYPYWTALTRQLQLRLEGLSLSYLSTGDERYAKRAIEQALTIAGWNTWVEQPYNNSLSVSHLTVGMSTVYDLLYDVMSEEERATIRASLMKNGIGGLLSFSRRWSRELHNGAALIHSALGFAALTLVGEEDVAQYIQEATDYARWWLDEAMYSGQTEDVLYTGYALDYVTRYLLALKNATGQGELLRHPFYTEHLTQWLTHFSGTRFDSVVNFGDSSYESYSSFILPLTILNLEENDAHAGWLLKQWGVERRRNTSDFSSVVYNVGTIGETAPPTSWSTAMKTNFDWVAMRTGWEPGDTLVAFKSSKSNQGHNHFDQNHFTINVNGEWLIIDRGYKDYNAPDYTAGTEGHNALLFDGKGQQRKGGGKITRFADGQAITYTVGDATDSYNEELMWNRHILMVKPGGYYLFFDEVEARSAKAAFFGTGTIDPKTFTFLLHPAVALSKRTVDGEVAQGMIDQKAGELAFYGRNAALLWKFVWPTSVQVTQRMPSNAAGHSGYLAIGADNKVMSTLLVSLVKGAAGTDQIQAPQVEVSDEASHDSFVGIAVARDGGEDVIVWNRGSGPVEWKGIVTDADLAYVFVDAEGAVTHASVVGGQNLTVDGNTPSVLERL